MINRRVKSFSAIFTPELKVLILGTSPGKESEKNNLYYASKNNYFWDIMSELFNIKNPNIYQDLNKKTEVYLNSIKQLKMHKIGIWDVNSYNIYRGNSSSDSKIVQNGPVNKFDIIFQSSNIKTIILNGKKAAEQFKEVKTKFNLNNIKIIELQSTTRTSLTSKNNLIHKGEDLKELWKKTILSCLNS